VHDGDERTVPQVHELSREREGPGDQCL
jgi:hypothetical protein